MSTSSDESNEPDESSTKDDGPGISDDQLPEDLRPTDDNPLAKNPDEEGDEDDKSSGFKPDLGDSGDPGTPPGP